MNIRRMAVLLTMLAAVTLGSAVVAKADTAQLVVGNDPGAIGAGPYADLR